MPCFHPIQVPKKGFVDLPVTVPCGRCLGCRLDRRGSWAIRILDESKRHLWKWFATLTYSDDKLPKNGTLVKRHAQLWQKRLRKARTGETVRFFTVGEYGRRTVRPHYHSIIFGPDFPDKRRHSKSGDNQLYVSDELDRLWGHGNCWLGSVTPESAQYVAGYVVDKVTGPLAEARYARVDPETGDTVQVEPEFAIMSRRPGIGSHWYEEFKGDVFPSDQKVVRGKVRKVPQYYLDKLERENPEMHAAVKADRKAKARRFRKDSTPDRLAVREEVAAARLKLKRRS